MGMMEESVEGVQEPRYSQKCHQPTRYRSRDLVLDELLANSRGSGPISSLAAVDSGIPAGCAWMTGYPYPTGLWKSSRQFTQNAASLPTMYGPPPDCKGDCWAKYSLRKCIRPLSWRWFPGP